MALPDLQKNSKFKKEKNIILILGGADKGIDMSELITEIPKHCKAVILLPGTGTDVINSKIKIQKSKFKFKIMEVSSLKEAVEEAMKNAKKGDVLLFSPAFASFGMFKNEFDRGQQFDKLVKNL